MAQTRFVRPIPKLLHQSPKDFALALGETIVLYNASFPLWLHINIGAIGSHFRRKYHAKENGTDC